MPSRNVLKFDLANSYYHVYARGNSRQEIFLEPYDYAVFLNLLKRYLSKDRQFSDRGVPYPHLSGKLELLSFCLMPNHFHLLLYQKEEKAMESLMRGVMTSYSRYFNKKYGRSGALFESRYKASRISQDTYLMHISRYIHLNPKDWRNYPYSSLPFYLHTKQAEWVNPGKILGLFDNKADYGSFVSDYTEHKQMLDELKYELANPIIQ